MMWIILTIASFFLAAWLWTPFIAYRFGSIHDTRTAVIWITAVFGTWMIMLVPLIVVMYLKVDKTYEDARLRREKVALRFRSIYVEKSKRMIVPELAKKLEGFPDTIDGGQLVTLVLKDGRRISNVFIEHHREIIGIYDFTEFPFEAKDIADIEMTPAEQIPTFFVPNWLRLDGVSIPE
ncbi:MAG: hypothetical protein HYZ83_01040 [Candidatus Omnitrophica bacterium]|nr:hypothetical protein [Candidatus Omnitrophota bacterium]